MNQLKLFANFKMANKSTLLIDAYRSLKQTSDNVVLATIIETSGSTYQKAGAKMLIAREGVASSLRAGIQALPASTAAALILLCDQPLISPAHIQALLSGWQNGPARMAASQYNDSIGVPALFPAAFFRSLLELKGDQGAKRLLLEFGDSVLKIPLPEAELDIDTMDDFNHLTRHYSAEE